MFDVIAADPLIDSSQATPADWNWIAGEIATQHEGYDGFVVTHGTDTLAFTAAALCFALVGLQKPVVLTGAMKPLGMAGNDGLRNLGDAMAAVRSCEPGVWVQFAGHLMHGGRVQKLLSDDFEAFAARPGDAPPRVLSAGLERQVYGSHDIAVLTVAPGMSAAVAAAAIEAASGVVLRCYGSSTVPDGPGFRAALLVAQEREVPVLAVSQCTQGGIVMGTYAAGALLVDAEAIDGRGLTLEAGYAKMMMALSRFQGLEPLRAYLETPQCGEMAV